MTFLTVCDTLEGQVEGEKVRNVKRHSGALRRLGLVVSAAGSAICLTVLVGVVPARSAVELVAFYVIFGDPVVIHWETGSEVDVYGFNVYRTDTEQFSKEHPVNEQIIAAKGGIGGGDYECPDYGAEPGVTYYYWLEVEQSGGPKVFGPKPEPTPTPVETSTPAGTATARPTRTRTPTPTWTSAPAVTPSFTATAVPTATPTGTATSTRVSTSLATASTTGVAEPVVSPTPATGELTGETVTPGEAVTEPTGTPTSPVVAWGSDASPGDDGSVSVDSDGVPARASALRPRWPTIYPSTILLSISMMSFLGVLLLSLVLVALRRSDL